MPKTRTYSRSIDIDAPTDALYRFHLDTRNAPLISQASAKFLAINGEFPVVLGAKVQLKVKQPPIPVAQTWDIVIAELQENTVVVDVANKSPFAYWRHEHRFESLPSGGTRMTDRVTYALPFGPLGRIVDRVMARKQLVAMFADRQARTKALFEDPARSPR